MRLSKARIQKYRSIRDTGFFSIESHKTILVGPNEAGKTVLLQALQQLNAPDGVAGFDVLRDYPRSEYNDITTKRVDPATVTVVEAHFVLEGDDQDVIDTAFKDCVYVCGRTYANKSWAKLQGGPDAPTYGDVSTDFERLAAHMDKRVPASKDGESELEIPSKQLEAITEDVDETESIHGELAAGLKSWLKANLKSTDESNKREGERYNRLLSAVELVAGRQAALETLRKRLPVFVYFSNYFRVRPIIHLSHLAQRIEQQLLDDKYYDYGNQCLLKLLGFSAQELSRLGSATEPAAGDDAALKNHRDQLDNRTFQLNAASVRLTEQIREVWLPDAKRAEADHLRINVDGQYLKVVVEDELGVEIELDQRSEGFQWIVSFFVVFFAEAADKHENAILLLDEPGLSLHGLKQREFRTTVSRLAETNQTLYTTHSPFLVGPGELDLVRVVEMTDRKVGTKVHTTVSAGDPAAILPLQEALGYDLAQSLFGQRRNLVLEGLTDYWYLDATAHLLRDAGIADLNEKIALVPAGGAGKVVYYATILHAQKLHVVALLDSDAAGERAAQQETLLHTLGNKGILRTKDAYGGSVERPEIEDLLRETLIQVAKDDLGWSVGATATGQPTRPIVSIFEDEIDGFSKYKLAKAYLRWTRNHEAGDLADDELSQWKKQVKLINAALK